MIRPISTAQQIHELVEKQIHMPGGNTMSMVKGYHLEIELAKLAQMEKQTEMLERIAFSLKFRNERNL